MIEDKLNKIYKLFAPCIPIDGYTRSVIIDLHRHNLFFIPYSLFILLEKHYPKSWTEISKKLDIDSKAALEEYLLFLELNELIFSLEKFELKRFPKLSLQWNFPSICSNAIIDISSDSKYIIPDTIIKLSQINCFHLQIRFFKKIAYTELVEIIAFSSKLTFQSIQILITNSNQISEKKFEQLMIDYWKIGKIEVFNSNQDKIIPISGLIRMIIFSKKRINIPSQCGNIDPRYFSIETNHFTEAQKHNTCLNRKLCIDQNGYVKNCPSMTQHFGLISECNLEEVIHSQEFQKLWFINKDQIDVCQDCEFRYICTDCRCFIQDENDIYSQPAKCKYNPYICKWVGEEDYISVSEWRTQNPKWNKLRKKEKN